MSKHRPEQNPATAPEVAVVPLADEDGQKTARRLRWSGNLPKPGSGDVPWAKKRIELAQLSEADHVLLLQQTRAWQDVMVPECRRIDAERSSRGLKFLYSSEDLELALLFGRACGHTTYKKTRLVLAGDDPRPRQSLGFDQPRNAHGQPRKVVPLRRRDGVPSEATISRHKKRFTDQLRAELWTEIERRLRQEHLETAELQAEASILNLDGSPLLTHFRAPRASKIHGGEYAPPEVTNGEMFQVVHQQRVKVTCPDGGYVPDSAGVDKCGHGWNLVMISTATGVPLAWRLVPLNASEKTVALDLVREDFVRDVAPYLAGKIKVLSADGAFHQAELRAELRQHGIVENIHLVSHARRRRSEKRAADFNAREHAIIGFPNWYANGHREIRCKCGRGVAKAIELGRNGEAVVRVEGKCPNCGTISVKSGDWRFTEDDTFVRCMPDEAVRERDWALGNPLTFNDLNAQVYGRARFGHNEGLHGTLSNRYALIRNKRWFRRLAQAQTDTAMTFALMQTLSLEQRRRASAPPGLAAAA